MYGLNKAERELLVRHKFQQKKKKTYIFTVLLGNEMKKSKWRFKILDIIFKISWYKMIKCLNAFECFQ